MTVRNEIVVSSNNNEKVIGRYEWIATLSYEEKARFWRAEIRQRKYRQDAINKGDMIIDFDTGNYIWKDSETAKKGKLTDGVWLGFWNRYLSECNLHVESKFKEE